LPTRYGSCLKRESAPNALPMKLFQ
jgi:hypothetical protein